MNTAGRPDLTFSPRSRAAIRQGVLLALVSLTAGLPAWAQGVLDKRIAFDIPAQPLESALIEFSRQANVQLIMSTNALRGYATRGLKGEEAARSALMKLLADTDLEFVANGNTVQIRSVPAAHATRTSVIRLAGGQAANDSQAAESSRQAASSTIGDEPESSLRVEEVVVTGTHIRGAGQSASPVLRFTREDILRSGAGNTEQFIQTLPQNFSGGVSARNLAGPGGIGGENAGQNVGFGTGVNLRGLGNGSTLVLLDGRRLAPASFGYAVDISMIPVDAIEGIEVLTDGASAIYGSDAVGGVVNIKLRKDFEGIESAARYGSVTDGGHDTLLLSQALGKRWGSGSALISYHFYDQSGLEPAERRATQNVPAPTDLIGEEDRHSVVFTLSLQAKEGLTLFGNAIYSERQTDLISSFGSTTQTDASMESYGGSFGSILDMPLGWQTELSASYNRTHTLTERNFTTLGIVQTFDTRADVTSLDVKADGDIVELPGGSAKMALGAHVRRESYESSGTAQPTLGTKRRNVRAAYAELLVPVVGHANRRTGLSRLELTLAGRFEDYDDFGSKTIPKIGVLWAPSESLTVRATAGESFRAPLLFELDEHSFSSVQSRNMASPSGPLPTLIRRGNNPGLTAETSRNWTVGVDFEPVRFPDFSLSVTYFDIDYRDRITVAIPSAELNGVFQNEARYAAVILRDPEAALVNELFAHPNFVNTAQLTPSDVRAIVDSRLINIARRRESGIDLNASLERSAGIGTLSFRLGATCLLSFDDQLTPTSPAVELLDSVYFPAGLRARGSVGYSRRALNVTGFVNYVDDYRDTRTSAPTGGPFPRPTVGSWTTLDLNVGFDFGYGAGQSWLGNLNASLSVQNLLDKEPPFVAGAFGLNYDPANADILGRFVSLRVRKGW